MATFPRPLRARDCTADDPIRPVGTLVAWVSRLKSSKNCWRFQSAPRPHPRHRAGRSGKSTTLYALARHFLATTPGPQRPLPSRPLEQRIDAWPRSRLLRMAIGLHPGHAFASASGCRSAVWSARFAMPDRRRRRRGRAYGHLILSTMHSGDPAEAVIAFGRSGVKPALQAVRWTSARCSYPIWRVPP